MADETTNTTTSGELGVIQVTSDKLTNIDYFMSGNENLTEVDCPFPHVTTAKEAFRDCTKLKTFKGGSNSPSDSKGFPKLQNADGLLYKTAIAQFSTNDVPMPAVTNASSMLWSCPNLSSVHLRLPLATNANGIVQDCPNLKYVEAYMDSLGTEENVSLTLPNGVLTATVSLQNAKYFQLPSTVTTANITVGAMQDCSQLIPSESALTNLTLNVPAATTFGGNTLPTSLTRCSLSFGALQNGDNLLKGSNYNFSISGLGNLTSANDMFNGCSGVPTEWETNLPSLTSANGMFKGCTGLVSIKSSMPSLVEAKSMFEGCTGLQYAYLHLASKKDETSVSSLKDGSGMFKDCTSLQLIAGKFISQTSSGGKYEPIVLNSLENGKEMFKHTHITTFGTVDNAIDMPKLENGTGMFSGISNKEGQHNYLATFNAKAPKLVDGSYMFAYNPIMVGYDQTASRATFKLDNTTTTIQERVDSHLNNGSSMFYGCSSLIKINREMINLSGLVYGDNMFKGCSSLVSVEASCYSLLAGMNMFCGCQLDNTSLEYIALHINNLVEGGWVKYNEEGKKEYLREGEWKYKMWSDTVPTTIAEGDEGGQTNITEVEIPSTSRAVIHVDYQASVTPEQQLAFQKSLYNKGWKVTSCTGPNTNLSISEDNKVDTDDKSFVEDISAWKTQRYQRYNMKITSITSRTNSEGKVEGVMYGTSDVHPESTESGDSGTES